MRAVFFVATTVAFGIMELVAAYIEGQGWSLLGCGLAGIALGAFIGNWALTRFWSNEPGSRIA